MANTISMCANQDCTRDVKTYPGSGKCNACYKRERYHLTKTPEVLARRAANTRASNERKKQAGTWEEQVRRTNLKKYGITPERYDAQFELQGGMCALCGKEPGTRRLAVDHDHETGALRGLLCENCNQALGKFKDDIRVLARAIAYLQGGGVWD